MTIRVIIADDHKVIRDGLKAIMASQAEIEVVGTASDGMDALEITRNLKPDVAILDINMPNLNGIETTREISESCPDTDVIILSMHGNKEHVYQALKAGARGYLIKESSGLEVVDAIRAINNGERYLSQTITATLIDAYVEQREGASMTSVFDLLSSREKQVLQLVVEGKSSVEISEVLHISKSTVNTYRSRLMSKLDVKDVPSLVRLAIEHNII